MHHNLSHCSFGKYFSSSVLICNLNLVTFHSSRLFSSHPFSFLKTRKCYLISLQLNLEYSSKFNNWEKKKPIRKLMFCSKQGLYIYLHTHMHTQNKSATLTVHTWCPLVEISGLLVQPHQVQDCLLGQWLTTKQTDRKTDTQIDRQIDKKQTHR